MQRTRETEFILIQHIDVTNRLRPLNDGAVSKLVESMQELGLRTPITVRVDPADENPDVFLVAGYHRLEAAKRLGWDEIECFVTEEADEDLSRMWEIAENLHRGELTALEVNEHRAEYLRLYNKRVSAKRLAETKRVESGRPEGGISAASRAVGISRQAAEIADKIADIVPEAKEIARDSGLDTNTASLVKIARAPVSEQVSIARDLAERKASRIDADIKDRAANECAQIIAEYVPGDVWDSLKANLYASGANNIANALTNITGQSIMDKRFA